MEGCGTNSMHCTGSLAALSSLKESKFRVSNCSSWTMVETRANFPSSKNHSDGCSFPKNVWPAIKPRHLAMLLCDTCLNRKQSDSRWQGPPGVHTGETEVRLCNVKRYACQERQQTLTMHASAGGVRRHTYIWEMWPSEFQWQLIVGGDERVCISNRQRGKEKFCGRSALCYLHTEASSCEIIRA